MSQSRRVRVAVALGVLTTVLLPAASSEAAARCVEVSGSYTERPSPGRIASPRWGCASRPPTAVT